MQRPLSERTALVVKDLADQPKAKYVLAVVTPVGQRFYLAVDGWRERNGIVNFYRDLPASWINQGAHESSFLSEHVILSVPADARWTVFHTDTLEMMTIQESLHTAKDDEDARQKLQELVFGPSPAKDQEEEPVAPGLYI